MIMSMKTSASIKPHYLACRHGARTPLSDSTYLWGDTVWNVAGQPFEVSLNKDDIEAPAQHSTVERAVPLAAEFG